jgi:hypothetical protein
MCLQLALINADRLLLLYELLLQEKLMLFREIITNISTGSVGFHFPNLTIYPCTPSNSSTRLDLDHRRYINLSDSLHLTTLAGEVVLSLHLVGSAYSGFGDIELVRATEDTSAHTPLAVVYGCNIE